MKLFDALLCLDCDELCPRASLACPSCTNTVLVPLTEYIDPLQDRDEIDRVHAIQEAGK
jgi:hypothetical protein